MDRNFKVCFIAGFGIFFVALITLYIFESLPFKIFFSLFATVAMIELFSFFRKKSSILNIVLALVQFALLVGSVIFVFRTNLNYYWYVILGGCGYDIFAYLFGKAFGGKVFKKARPFPHISKNKTWEGTILGLLSSFFMLLVLMCVRGNLMIDFIYLFCGPLALIGDLLESAIKRTFKVKDSNEVVIKNKFFEKLEYVVGGSEGHGGFLDRIDSVAFLTTAFLIISLFI